MKSSLSSVAGGMLHLRTDCNKTDSELGCPSLGANYIREFDDPLQIQRRIDRTDKYVQPGVHPD